MNADSRDARSRAEEHFEKARVTNDNAQSIIKAEQEAQRKKSAEAQRLAIEVREGITDLDRKEPPPQHK